jgi:hypothetical protein
VAAPPRSPEEIAQRRQARELRRRQVRRRRIGALVVLLAVVGGGAGAALALSGGSGKPASAPPPGETLPTTPESTQEGAAETAQPVAERSRPDGSLGAKNVRLACSLLEKSEIKAQFGGPVGRPTPMWPYCQWTIGRDAWIAVWVGPKTSIQKTRDRSYVLEDVAGLGDDAFFGTDRYLYFGQGGVSYYVVYQKANEFVEIHKEELIALAQAILSRPLDQSAAPPAGTGDVAEVEIAKPTRQDRLRVYFGGDSLSAGPEWAFGEAARETKLVNLSGEYQVGTGLIRSDYFDWKRHLEGVMRAKQPEVAIFMGGANDSQDFIIDGTYYPNTTAVWRREYSKRVGAVMDVLAADGREVVWVGMPPMRDADLNAGMQAVNAVFEEQAGKRPSVTYVDTWSLFSAPGGGYTDTIDGEGVRLEDGIHLNVPGSELLAGAILDAVAEIAGLPRNETPA